MPANYYWAPPTVAPPAGSPPSPAPQFADVNNWRIDRGPTVLATEVPDADDHLYFDGGLSSVDCVIPAQTVTSGNAFAGIHLIFGYGTPVVATNTNTVGGHFGEDPPPPPPTSPPPPTPTRVWMAYTGTVTTSNSFEVGVLDVDCGQISQGSSTASSGNASTLTVTSSLDWTGGTLNSNTVAGTIALAPGATGIAEPSFDNPGINGAVELGSTLKLLGDSTAQNGSTFELRDGTYNVARGHFEVEKRSTLICAPRPSSAGTGVTINPKGENIERQEDGSIINHG